MRIARLCIPAVVCLLLSLLPPCSRASLEAACGRSVESGTVANEVVDHYVADAALGRRWAIVVDCRHPGWPPHAVAAAGSVAGKAEASSLANRAAASSEPAELVVQAGSQVELWSDSPARIRLSGIALQSGRLGQWISVKTRVQPVALHGIVRGPDSVELEAGAASGREP